MTELQRYQERACIAAATQRLHVILGRYRCPDCGTVDGMQEWDPASVYALQLSEQGVVTVGPWLVVGVKFWRYHSRNDVIYSTCPMCNDGEVVPEGFTPLTPEQVRRWLTAMDAKG